MSIHHRMHAPTAISLFGLRHFCLQSKRLWSFVVQQTTDASKRTIDKRTNENIRINILENHSLIKNKWGNVRVASERLISKKKRVLRTYAQVKTCWSSVYIIDKPPIRGKSMYCIRSNRLDEPYKMRPMFVACFIKQHDRVCTEPIRRSEMISIRFQRSRLS